TADAWRHVAPDVTVVPNGVDFRRWPLGPGGDNLVWFGRITAEKAPHLAIAAARRADMPLVLAGPISDEDYFKHSVAPLLGERVRYAGNLDQDALGRLVGRSAAALATPVWHEPYGLVVAKRCRAARPLWLSPVEGYPKSCRRAAG